RLDHQVAERHDEQRREHQRQQHAVGGHREVVEVGRAERQLDAGAGQRLHHGHHRADREGRHRHPEVREDEPDGGRHGAASTMIVLYMLWWPSPQYSLQTTRYSPGSVKVVVPSLTYPGATMRLTFVPTI